MPKLTDNQHRNIVFWGMAMIAMGLPLSVFLVNVGTFVLAGNWLLEGRFKKRLRQFFTDPLSLILISTFLFFCLGMIWTENVSHGLKELRIKLPILLMPLLLFTSKMPDKKRQQELLFLFVLACLVGSVFGAVRYFEIWGGELINKRHMSLFISHIRFGLMLTLSFFILAYFLFTNWKQWSLAGRLICVATMLWLLWFLTILGAVTAYVTFATLLAYSLLRLLLNQKSRLVRASIVISMSFLVFGATLYIKDIADHRFQKVPVDFKTLNTKSINGNLYEFKTHLKYSENGHHLWSFICWKELKREWPKLSTIGLNELDRKGQEINYTLIRYMTSKGLKKDSVGIHRLTKEDVRNIEHGFTNFRYTDKLGFSRRIDDFFWALEEYTWKENANNSSALQRWVSLKVGWEIFSKNPLFGVGTGDVFDAYKESYKIDNHYLFEKFQIISHNQILTISIATGVFGLVVFLISFIYPMAKYKDDYLYITFALLILVSFLSDNTFDRQSGVTLFAFFNSFLIVRREYAEVGD